MSSLVQLPSTTLSQNNSLSAVKVIHPNFFVTIRRCAREALASGLLIAFALPLLCTQAFAQNQPSSTLVAESPKSPSISLTQSTAAVQEDEPKPEMFHYVRLNELTGEGNTQYTYTPAKFDFQQLHRNLRYPANALKEGKHGRVDVVVYLNAEGVITQMNYIGEQTNTRNDFAESACAAVKKCSFTPAYRNNKPVHAIVVIPVKFVF